MSSGEKAKPPATFEERNPFDISRRSGPEVAGEIAKRMAAWKQARARTSPAPTTCLNPSRRMPPIQPRFQPADAKLPPIAAPVQPARMPRAVCRSRRQAASRGRQAGSQARCSPPRVPLFATVSAMPSAPCRRRRCLDERPLQARGDPASAEPATPCHRSAGKIGVRQSAYPPDRGNAARARSVRPSERHVEPHQSERPPPRHRRRPNRLRPNAAAPKRAREGPLDRGARSGHAA